MTKTPKGQLNIHRRTYDLDGLSLYSRKGRAPSLMPANDMSESAFERCHIERPPAVHSERFIVDRQLGRKLRVDPHLLLRKR